ncbi:LAME_0A00650g1_1 [Lachancea meyersii CBS 8951]|uniref:LAME_0A00650g1_1 n=1 Tax=Lachancea meyersii CBS 8951 TaxID=1266667 RepID=A0A1G4ILU2_9SACH|nr:LAME_0A00650g1_1 [Lachancea meyersii CBS 8951]
MKPSNKPSKPNRISHVCDHCRLRKLKCSKDKPTCTRCAKLGLQCVYTPYRQNNRDSTTSVEALELELKELKAKLASCSKARGDTRASVVVQNPQRKRPINWNSLVSPINVHGIWKTYYAPFSDLALFARDPRLKARVTDLFEQQIALTKLPNRNDDLLISIRRLLPQQHILREAKFAFESTIYPSYPFYNLEAFHKFYEDVLYRPSVHNGCTQPIHFFILLLLMLCLTENLAINPDLINEWIQQAQIASQTSEENPACLLYLKLYSSPVKLSLTSKPRLTDDICRMAFELGLFTPTSCLLNSELRRNLWMGCVILVEPTSFDEHFLDMFDTNVSCTVTPLLARYRFSSKLSKVWKCVMTTSDELEEALLSLSSYGEIQAQANLDASLIAGCNLTAQSTKFNLLIMQFLQEEHDGMGTESSRIQMQNSFDETLVSLRDLSNIVTSDKHLLRAQTIFCLKSLSSYVLSISSRLVSENKISEISKLKCKLQEAVQLWLPNSGWCDRICNFLNGECGGSVLDVSDILEDPFNFTSPDFQIPQSATSSNNGLEELSPTLSLESFESFLTDSLPTLQEQFNQKGPLLSSASKEISTDGDTDFDLNTFL